MKVRDPVEERHAPDYPWPEPRARGVIVAVAEDHVMVRWGRYGEPRRVERDRIGNSITDVIRSVAPAGKERS